MRDNKSTALPFETSTGFTAIPNAVCMYYVRHPKFTPAAERVYRYLLQRHNNEWGYAFPSYNSIMYNTGIGSKETVSTALDNLEHLELIKRSKHEGDSGFINNVYTFLKPIESEYEFHRKFGRELKAKYKRKSTSSNDDLIDWL